MNNNFLVSIIIPVYNAAAYIEKAIQSVLHQTYPNIELLIINDGSTDSTNDKILKFEDTRIRYFTQENQGVSAARNLGLENMRGDFFCFLDADDVMPPNSILARLNVFNSNSEIDYVDGIVLRMNQTLTSLEEKWMPSFTGYPLKDLVRLTAKCFFGPSWMIRNIAGKQYEFLENLKHGEDLLFFMELARKGGKYAFVNEAVLLYRNTPGSAMKDLTGLEHGYRLTEQEIRKWTELSIIDLLLYSLRWRKFMAFDYVRGGSIMKLLGLIRL